MWRDDDAYQTSVEFCPKRWREQKIIVKYSKVIEKLKSPSKASLWSKVIEVDGLIMYYMAISIFLILFGLLWTFAGMRVCKKLYDKVRNEDHQERGKVIQRIMKTYAMAQLVSWPLVMITAWFLHVNKSIFRFVEVFCGRRKVKHAHIPKVQRTVDFLALPAILHPLHQGLHCF